MIVTLVSVDFGKITATARGCLKPKAKLRYAAEPFNFGEYVLSGKNDRYVITECNQIESFSGVTADIERYYAGFSVLNALEKVCREQDIEAFTHALSTLGSLAYDYDKSADLILTEYLKGLLASGGSELDFGHCNVCKCDLEDIAYFSEKDGIVCKHCKGVFGDVAIDAAYRAYINGENAQAPHEIAGQANILLSNLVYQMLGVKIDTRYFTE